MSLVLGGFVLGALIGTLTARKRGGNRADLVQYAAGYGIALAVAGLFISIALARLA